MNDNTYELQQNEEDPFSDGVSDEFLESASGNTGEMANYTLGSCTGLVSCPA
jgi:hypothetical protein